MEIQAQDFGIEIEMTGITRSRAAEVIAEYFGTSKEYEGGYYDAYYACDSQRRKWKVMSDGSIDCQKRDGRRKISADRNYSVELVSPICQYRDIETVQELIRKLREAGAFVNPSCGIHIHINAAPFNAPKLRNLVNIMAAKEDMIYRALQVSRGRETSYCQKIDPLFLERINRQKPSTMESGTTAVMAAGSITITAATTVSIFTACSRKARWNSALSMAIFTPEKSRHISNSALPLPRRHSTNGRQVPSRLNLPMRSTPSVCGFCVLA